MIQSRSPVSRRQFSRLLAGGSLAVVAGGLATVATVKPASAGRSWCKTDPEFLINGKLLHVYLSGPVELHQTVTGPSQVTLYVPSNGVDAQFIWADDGFGGLGYTWDIHKVDWLVFDPLTEVVQFEVQTIVPASEQLVVVVEAVHEPKSGLHRSVDQRRGFTNLSMKLRSKL